jgi:hypothetical protein
LCSNPVVPELTSGINTKLFGKMNRPQSVFFSLIGFCEQQIGHNQMVTRLFVTVALVWLVQLACADNATRRVVNPTTQGIANVTYTAQGVPFISADTEADLFFTQGKIVAENRLWQMEFFRRFMVGTLSEIYGNVTLQSDINHRRMRWVDICTKNIANTPAYYLEIVGYGKRRFMSFLCSNAT